MHSDDETWVFKGVTRWTKEEELPRVMRSIDAGRPVVLGLVVARSLAAIGDNHQVIAYGYEQDRNTGRVTVQIHDNNTPGRPVTLTSGRDQHDWTASNGHRWRGFFVQDYTPKRPRVLTKHAPDVKDQVSTGDTVKLSHVWTGLTLHSHDRRTCTRDPTACSRSRPSAVPTTTTAGCWSAPPGPRPGRTCATARWSGCATSRRAGGSAARRASRRRSPTSRRSARRTPPTPTPTGGSR